MRNPEGPRTGYGHMVHDYFTGKVRAKNLEREKTLASLRSREDALSYRRRVKSAVKKAFPAFPEKTALNPGITGTIKRPGYRIEKLVFESRPGVPVTANLYMPAGGTGDKGKHPGVIMPCGHSAVGKAAPRYQEVCQKLVQSGFAVLIYDPFNQGERNQYLGYRGPAAEELNARCVSAHNMMGKQLELTGGFFGSWRAWDGIRALDYLLSRPEVDRTRVGLTGNSGGGTLTTWLWALDERFTMAAPSCFITTFLANLENELPADCEQCPPGVIGKGLEMSDFLIARAPEPLIILGQKYDFFDRRGLEKSYRDLSRVYRLLGKEENARRFVGDNPHGYYPDAQDRMLSFFCKHAGLGKNSRPGITISRPETLFALPGGEVIKSGAVPVFKKIEREAGLLIKRRKKYKPVEFKSVLRGILKIPSLDFVPHYRVLRPGKAGGRTVIRLALETEANIRVIMKKPAGPGRQTCIIGEDREANVYIPHVSSEADLSAGAVPGNLAEEPSFYSLDVRGLGESMPDETPDFFYPYGMDYMFHAYSQMLGESYAGRRVYDCLCALNLLKSSGVKKITLCGRGQGALIALFAAVFHRGINSLILKNLPESFESWVKTPAVLWPAANFPRGILEHFDIEDCLKMVRADVRILEPWDSFMAKKRAGARS